MSYLHKQTLCSPRIRTVPAEFLYNELKKEGVLVRYFNKPGIDNYLRITIGTDEQMEQLVEKLSEIFNLELN